MVSIHLQSVRKSYQNGSYAVQGVDLNIADGEFVVFVGPSGCGKSTLLRMIAGLESITDGDISIGTRRVNDVSPADRDVAMVFQNYALYPHMTVYKNLAYGLKNRKMDRDEIDRRVRDAATMLQIQDFLERKPSQLSGGQRQRVAMGRALARQPQVFLFDEPLSNLDAKLRVEMRIEIKKLQKRLGVTSVYVTHDQTEAMTLADRVVVINNGRFEQVGTPMEVYNTPANAFVASFIGTPQINLHPAEQIKPCLGAVLDHLPQAIPSNAQIGLRPEHVKADSAGPIRFMPEVIEQHGAENILYGHLVSEDGGKKVEDFCIRQPQDSPSAAGEVMTLNVDPARIMAFNAETGARLS